MSTMMNSRKRGRDDHAIKIKMLKAEHSLEL
jgi:hypothetical protein